MAFSAKIIFRTDHIRKDGTVAVALQILIDRKRKVLPLHVYWPHDRIDTHKRRLLPRYRGDKSLEEQTLILDQAIARAGDIYRQLRLAGITLTIDRFLRDWHSDGDRNNLPNYMEQAMKERLHNHEISYQTYKVNLRTVVKLRRWRKDTTFADLDERWAYEFDAFLKRDIKSQRGNSQNSRWQHHKNIKTYLHYATKKDHKQYDDPYKYFTIHLIESTWKPINAQEFALLWEYYHTTTRHNHRLTLRRFLFACTTGLRVSDLYRVRPSWLYDRMLVFIPHKTRRSGKSLTLPLSQLAMTLFQEAVQEKGDTTLFDDIAEQKSNEMLKVIARQLGIKKNLHHHVARSSFITLYLEHGGKIDMAQELAGHADIKTTMGYNHITQQRKQQEIRFIDQILPVPTPPSKE